MSRFLLAFCLVSCALAGRPTEMEGQKLDEPTLYDAQALRVESRDADRVVVRGRDGIVLGKLSGFRGGLDLSAVVAPSPNAVREARDFSKSYRRGSWAVFAGVTAMSAGVLVMGINDVDPAILGSVKAASLGGFVLAVYGATQLNKAYTALSRSIWWYNRDLGR